MAVLSGHNCIFRKRAELYFTQAIWFCKFVTGRRGSSKKVFLLKFVEQTTCSDMPALISASNLSSLANEAFRAFKLTSHLLLVTRGRRGQKRALPRALDADPPNDPPNDPLSDPLNDRRFVPLATLARRVMEKSISLQLSVQKVCLRTFKLVTLIGFSL